MPENKNQHFVPKAYLRPFSMDARRRSINVFNTTRRQCIRTASIKGQCARSWLYGRNLEVEKALQVLEGVYAKTVAKVERDPAAITNDDLEGLRAFALLQAYRTSGHIQKLKAMAEQQWADMAAAASPQKKSKLPRPLSFDDMVKMSMSLFINCREYVADLDVCLLINRTRREFVTSDDPVIHTNRLHFQKLRSEAFGIGSAGAMLYLPLTPLVAVVIFDPNVYLINGRQENIVVITEEAQISAFNEMEILHADQNLYYSSEASGAQLVSDFSALAPSRPVKWHRFVHFEKSGETDLAEHYAPTATPSLAPGGNGYLTTFSFVHVKPSNWPKVLKFRLKPNFIETGTGAGCIRPNSAMHRDFVMKTGMRTKPIVASMKRP